MKKLISVAVWHAERGSCHSERALVLRSFFINSSFIYSPEPRRRRNFHSEAVFRFLKRVANLSKVGNPIPQKKQLPGQQLKHKAYHLIMAIQPFLKKNSCNMKINNFAISQADNYPQQIFNRFELTKLFDSDYYH